MRYLTCQTQDVVAQAEMGEPVAGAGELLVRLTLCGVCGTDVSKVFGDYPKPQKLGHEVVGVVHAVGAGVTAFRVGQRVALAHHAPDAASHYATRGSETMDPVFKRSNIDPGGFSELIRVPALLVANTVVLIADHVSDDQAAFMEPMACCIRALDRVPLQVGDSAMVVGVGAVGVLFLPLLKAQGVATVAADMRRERLAVAAAWGAVADGVPGDDDLVASCESVSDGRGVDAVFLTMVNAETVKLALACVRDGGSIVVFGGKPGAVFPLPMWDIWLREINLVSSYSATPHGLKRAMALITEHPEWPLSDLISHRMNLGDAQSAFELVRDGKASKVVLSP
jgi:L-iditol 2-dehydrogenase